MLRISLLLLVVGLFGAAGSAEACEVVVVGGGGLAEVVRAAEVIVRALAEEEVAEPGHQGVFRVATQVRFRVLEVLKGRLESEHIQFNGVLSDRTSGESFDFQRPRGAGPSCYAIGYTRGSQYLLLLGRGDGVYSHPDDLTPYWAPERPTNEWVGGATDPWVSWVVQALKTGGA
jgi:hypothetical protein